MGDRVTVGMPNTAPLFNATGGHGAQRPAFSLVDLMVSMAVIAVLIAILIPSLKGVRDLADRVVCASNIRQAAIGLQMHADERNGEMPESVAVNVLANIVIAPQHLMAVRRDDAPHSWDGLGWLYRRDFLAVPDVYYCPAHSGDHPLRRYREAWRSSDPDVSVVINYQYRGAGPSAGQPHRLTTVLWALQPRIALISDGLRTQADFNHEDGANVVRADLSIGWFADGSGSLRLHLPKDEAEVDSSDKVEDAWEALDSPRGGAFGRAPGG